MIESTFNAGRRILDDSPNPKYDQGSNMPERLANDYN